MADSKIPNQSFTNRSVNLCAGIFVSEAASETVSKILQKFDLRKKKKEEKMSSSLILVRFIEMMRDVSVVHDQRWCLGNCDHRSARTA
jgi:hypothetical protein